MPKKKRPLQIERVIVYSDGTRKTEHIGPEHPIVGPLFELIEDQLTYEALVRFGVPNDAIDHDALRQIALSLAEEIDYAFTVARRQSGHGRHVERSRWDERMALIKSAERWTWRCACGVSANGEWFDSRAEVERASHLHTKSHGWDRLH